MKKIRVNLSFLILLSLIFCISCTSPTQRVREESTTSIDTTTLQNNDDVKVPVNDLLQVVVSYSRLHKTIEIYIKD